MPPGLGFADLLALSTSFQKIFSEVQAWKFAKGQPHGNSQNVSQSIQRKTSPNRVHREFQSPPATLSAISQLAHPQSPLPVLPQRVAPLLESDVTPKLKDNIVPANITETTAHSAEKNSEIAPLKSSKVPASRIGRLFHYGSLFAGLSMGAANEAFRRSLSPNKSAHETSVFMSDANIKRLVDKLTRMRGAALKIGQFISIQDAKLLPSQLEEILFQVQNRANYMPEWQTQRVLQSELGMSWRDAFASFNMIPLASASIGQVHYATLARDSTPVAVKIQFPGVATSIDSDLSNLGLLLSASALLPRGLYLENTLKVMRRELKEECDYRREACSAEIFKNLLQDDPAFSVPRVVTSLSTARVLTSEYLEGTPLNRVKDLTSEERDWIGSQILRLSLRELFHFSFMQTDPNWTNFLWNPRSRKIELLDFGASREYSQHFTDMYLKLLKAGIDQNREDCIALSIKLGYFTGDESQIMINAHVESLFALGEPFRSTASQFYHFENQTITDRVRAQIPIMLRHRLTPPPEETYSLNRKLSGCFLLCARLGSRINCRDMFKEIIDSMQIQRQTAAERKQSNL